MKYRIATLILILLCVCQLKSDAVTYIVQTEKYTIEKVNIEYEPQKWEVERLEVKLDRWYQSNKNVKDKYYINRAKLYICKNIAFDYDYKTTGWRAFTPYTILDTKKATCMGYTALMQLLLDKKGIINILICDVSKPHIWNCMLIDNEWIDIDVTYYDAESEV